MNSFVNLRALNKTSLLAASSPPRTAAGVVLLGILSIRRGTEVPGSPALKPAEAGSFQPALGGFGSEQK
jgi:hypothetical protein